MCERIHSMACRSSWYAMCETRQQLFSSGAWLASWMHGAVNQAACECSYRGPDGWACRNLDVPGMAMLANCTMLIILSPCCLHAGTSIVRGEWEGQQQ